MTFSDERIEQWAQSFKAITEYLIQSKSIDRVGNNTRYVDVVRDVINLVPVYWIANEIVRMFSLLGQVKI